MLASLPLDRFFSDGYSFLVEMLFVASRRGFTIVEVPITFVERREGQSKISNAVLLESAVTPWRLLANKGLLADQALQADVVPETTADTAVETPAAPSRPGKSPEDARG